MTMLNNYIEILRSELIPALGCTEPIAIAYASAKARDVLGSFPEKLELYCSGNVVKNVKGVNVPNACGLKGIDVAGVLGVVAGNSDKELEVLTSATESDVKQTQALIADGFVKVELVEGVANLYIRAVAISGEHSAEVTILNKHTFITDIKKDGKTLIHEDYEAHTNSNVDKSTLNVKDILDFADTVDVDLVKDLLDQQISMNIAISDEGLTGKYGAQIGKTLLDTCGNTVQIRAKARAAAGSDARMNGCSLPVVINSGSGNQGLTVSLPVIEYANEMEVSQEKLYRALLVSNLVAIYQKYYIGSLSAFCGAVSAATGAGAAITYLCGGTYEQIAMTIINSLANTGGIVCDGAKASCAAKIASSVEAAILGHNMAMKGICFSAWDGIIQGDVEDTIRSVGYVGRVGMKETDIEILKIMLGQVDLACCW